MDKLHTIIPKVLKKRGLKEHADSAYIVFLAQQWLDEHLPGLKGECTVMTLKDAELSVYCAHSVALQEIQGVSVDLRKFLAVECPFLPVSTIRAIRA